MSEMGLDEVEALLATPEPQKKKPASRKVSTDNRDITTWLKIPHTAERNCEVPNHDEAVTNAGYDPEVRTRNKGMTTIINDLAVCRVCFLSGADLIE